MYYAVAITNNLPSKVDKILNKEYAHSLAVGLFAYQT